jgi:anion-transporting  ArsA/GET3 family ATPase
MSSPAVITWVQVSQEEALRSNTEFSEELLARCQETLQQLQRRAKELAAKGRNVSPPAIESIDNMERQMRSLLTLSTSAEALKLVHAYYQRLKHPWIERMDAADEDIAREAAERKERLEIAANTGISEEAVQAARARAMESIGARSRLHC